MPRSFFRKRISSGEFLTLLSIAGSAVSIVWSWHADRELRIRESADRIRIEAATLTGKLIRAKDLYLSFYNSIQSDIEDVSVLMNESRDRIKTRDLMWKSLQQRRFELERRILDEQLEIAYTGLLPFDRGIDSLYNQVMSRMKSLHATQFKMMLTETESAILDFNPAQANETAILGNQLRGIVAQYREAHKDLLVRASAPITNHLAELIDTPDKILLNQ